jgi:hypothetical protein
MVSLRRKDCWNLINLTKTPRQNRVRSVGTHTCFTSCSSCPPREGTPRALSARSGGPCRLRGPDLVVVFGRFLNFIRRELEQHPCCRVHSHTSILERKKQSILERKKQSIFRKKKTKQNKTANHV